jgi:glycosyltransferase involved in cell wall biosynthesis
MELGESIQTDISGSRPRIAYLFNSFPVLSETFIVNEVLGIEQDWPAHLYSLFKPSSHEENPEAANLRARTFYLLPAARPFALIFSHLYFLLRYPGRYTGTLIFALKKRSPGNSLFKAVWHLAVRKKDLTKQERQDLLLHFVLSIPLARAMQRAGIEHIHAHFADAATSFALLTSRLLLRPFSITAHAYDIFTRQANFVEKFSGARFIITCTQYNKHYLLEKNPELDANKIHVVYHGINLEKFQRGKKQKLAPPLILSVGRLVPKKGMAVLIEACRMLKSQGLSFQCRIIGEGPERPRLEMQIKLNHLMDCVDLVGAVPPSEMIAHYEQATLFVLPCVVEEDGNRDGIPNVIAEAMSMRLPIISSEVSAIPELVENKINGILVQPGNPVAIAEAICGLLNSPAKASRWGNKGRTKVEQVFNAQASLLQLKNIFENNIVSSS